MTMDQINKIWDMLDSPDEEMQNLGIELMRELVKPPLGPNSYWTLQNQYLVPILKSDLSLAAFNLGQHEVQLRQYGEITTSGEDTTDAKE